MDGELQIDQVVIKESLALIKKKNLELDYRAERFIGLALKGYRDADIKSFLFVTHEGYKEIRNQIYTGLGVRGLNELRTYYTQAQKAVQQTGNGMSHPDVISPDAPEMS